MRKQRDLLSLEKSIAQCALLKIEYTDSYNFDPGSGTEVQRGRLAASMEASSRFIKRELQA